MDLQGKPLGEMEPEKNQNVILPSILKASSNRAGSLRRSYATDIIGEPVCLCEIGQNRRGEGIPSWLTTPEEGDYRPESS
jgi:hypothetical protein